MIPLDMLTADAVEQLLDDVDTVAIAADVLRSKTNGEIRLPPEAALYWTPGEAQTARSLALPAALVRRRRAGVKIVNANPANVDAGLPRASAMVVLFDWETARPIAILAGAGISAARTAAVSVVAIEACHHGAPRRVTVVGAGPLGRAHIRAVSRRFGSDVRVTLFDRVGTRASDLAQSLAHADGHAGVILASTDLEGSVRQADVVITCTTTTTGYIPASWLAPGSTVVNVSLDDLCDDCIAAAETILVDDWELVAADGRRQLGRLLREGRIAPPGSSGSVRAVDAELGDVLCGRARGRKTQNGLTIVNPFGMGAQDVALAAAVHDLAVARGMTTRATL